MSNAETSAIDVLCEAGLIPPLPLTVGSLVRCPTTDKPHSLDGAFVYFSDDPATLWWKDWRSGQSATWSSRERTSLTSDEKAIYKRHLDAAKKARDEEKAKRHTEAAQEAQAIYRDAIDCEGHPYLTAKGVSPVPGLKVSTNPNKYPALIVPRYEQRGRLVNLQFIFWGKDESGDEKWLKRPVTGGRIKGCYFAIGKAPDKPLIIAEGLSTGISIHEASGYPVLVAFGTANLRHVGRVARDRYPERQLLFYADNDIREDSKNPGVTSAREAALEVGGYLAIPELSTGGKGDANDQMKIDGKEAVMETIQKGFSSGVLTKTVEEEGQPEPLPDSSGGNIPPPQEITYVWPELIPFEQDEDLPPFPLDALPPKIREFVYHVAETVQAPVDMVGPCVLGAVQIACRGRYPVRLPNGHVEQACLYVVPIAPPSERKSGVIEIISRPLIEYEGKYNQDHAGEVNQSRSDLKLLQGRISSAEQQAIKEKDTIKRLAAERELQALNTELAEFVAFEPLRLYGADCTPEKLAAMIKSQGGVFALMSGEGGGLFENIGRYSEKGGLELYLNGYSGDRVCVDRKSSDSIIIDRPSLTLIAPCQPTVINDLFSDRQKSGRGLLSRILFVKCVTRVGSRTATGKPFNRRIADNYRNLCCDMLASGGGGNLAYDDGGFKTYASFFDEIEPQLTPDTGELSAIADWAGKLPGQMTRLAGLIHCIAAFEQGKNPLDTMIDADEASAAVALAKYYLAHTKAVYGAQAEPKAVSNARYLWGRLKNLESISKRELIRKTHGKQDFNLDESLSELGKRGYTRTEYALTGGRPSETIFTNPESRNIVTKVSKVPNINSLDTKVTLVTIKPEFEKADCDVSEGKITGKEGEHIFLSEGDLLEETR